ncbi:hypothetical protein Tco_0156720 [Tanacetum coccineum]
MITTSSRIGSKKPSGLILPPMGILEISSAAEAWWAHNPQVPQIKVSHPPRFYQDLKKFYWLSSRGVALEVSRRVKGAIEGTYVPTALLKTSTNDVFSQSSILILGCFILLWNILNNTSVSSDYFPASSGSSSFNSSENSTDNIIPPVFSSFYNNPCLKDVQAFYAKELPISSPDPITPPAILTPSSVLQPSLQFDPRYFFVPEELLPHKKRICSPSSSSTTLPNPSRNQTCDLVSPSFSVYTPTPPQIFKIGRCSIKMCLKHHEEQVEDILNYLDELYLHRIERMEKGRINRMITQRNSNKLKIELERVCSHIIKLQRKKLGQKDKIAFAHYRISDLERIIKKI